MIVPYLLLHNRFCFYNRFRIRVFIIIVSSIFGVTRKRKRPRIGVCCPVLSNVTPNVIPNVILRFGEYQFTSDNGCTDVY